MPAASPREKALKPGGGWRTTGDALAAFGWITFAICVALFLLWYVHGLKANGVSGRIAVVTNPDAPRDQWLYEPAADVEVFVRWNGGLASSLIQFENYCARTLTVRTDRDGRFSADGWWETPRWPPPRVDPGHPFTVQSWPDETVLSSSLDPAGRIRHGARAAAAGFGNGAGIRRRMGPETSRRKRSLSPAALRT